MKNFTKFITESHEEIIPIQTCFGKHSLSEEGVYTEPYKIDEEMSHHPDHEVLDKTLQKHYNGYTGKEIHHLRQYTVISSQTNQLLHRNAGKTYPKLVNHNEHVKRIDSAIHAHTTPHDLHVYTGLSHTHGIENKKSPVKTIHHGYMSTSLDKNKAKEFTEPSMVKHDKEKNEYHEHHHVLKIHVPKGHPGAYVEHHTQNPGEKELILPRGTKLKLHPHKETETETRDEGGVRVHIHHHIHKAEIL